MQLRMLTLNLFGLHADWPKRREVLREEIERLSPDLVTFQEAVTGEGVDSARDVLPAGYFLHHQQTGLVGDRSNHGASIASRWPILAVHEVDLHLTARTGDYSCGAVIAEVDAPAPLGRLLVACHGSSWQWWAERERELQAVALLRTIEGLVQDDPRHVVIGGDFNASPETASMRLFTGRQSLDGLSVAYRDCWESVHGADPGHTFDPGNDLTRIDEPGLDRGRRIDYLLVRCEAHGPTLEIVDCRLALAEPVGGVVPSDHYGVVADLATRRPAP